MDHLSRRQILEILGAAAGTAALPDAPARGQAMALPSPPARPYSPPKHPVTCVIIGHGGRGTEDFEELATTQVVHATATIMSLLERSRSCPTPRG